MSEENMAGIYFEKIRGINIENQINNIYDWYKSDPNNQFSDPNAYELVDMHTKVNNFMIMHGKIDDEVIKKLYEITYNRKENFVRNNLGVNNIAYKILEDVSEGELSKTALTFGEASSLRKMAGISLWFEQQKREGKEPEYNNIGELNDLLESLNDSRSIINKYSFPMLEAIKKAYVGEKELFDVKNLDRSRSK